MIYLALGAGTACLIELPRRHWAHKSGAAMRADAHDGCMKFAWRKSGKGLAMDADPYDLEQESRHLKELTSPAACQVREFIYSENYLFIPPLDCMLTSF